MFKIITTINLITFLFGVPTHTPIEIADNHGIYATAMVIDSIEVYDMGTPNDIEDDSGKITFVDGNGEAWDVEQYPEDYTVGDIVGVLMDDNGTPSIYDDIILDFHATGFWYE